MKLIDCLNKLNELLYLAIAHETKGGEKIINRFDLIFLQLFTGGNKVFIQLPALNKGNFFNCLS